MSCVAQPKRWHAGRLDRVDHLFGRARGSSVRNTHSGSLGGLLGGLLLLLLLETARHCLKTKAVETQGKGSVFARKSGEIQGRGTVLAARAAEI